MLSLQLTIYMYLMCCGGLEKKIEMHAFYDINSLMVFMQFNSSYVQLLCVNVYLLPVTVFSSLSLCCIHIL